MITKDTLFVFDIDGTLTDSIPTYLPVITKVLADIGLQDIDTDYDNYLHHTDLYALEYNYERTFNKKAPANLRYELDHLLGEELSKCNPVSEIPGARSLLLKLQEMHIPFAYGTGAFPKATAIKMEGSQVPFIPEVLATSLHNISRVGFVKEAIQKSEEYYNRTSFDNIIAVGDGLWDLKAAQELDISFLGIGTKNREAMLDNGCKNWVEDYRKFDLNSLK
ncbi:haloacid dehalogenase-like hydrolase [Dokdonia sp. Hel_I_63]|uniref:HAD family hydrolase n=1 Tax=unclassified Dokdonia TaxID=2615033 RepID=UPI00020A664E|nr:MULTISPECIES: HAD family hydrolase [unclassified Dokdonia]AEE18935.1 Haloacid dehalogenase domain protein hydrolase [Dokdonia sp. 4H-3-7-5]TVZ21838.1 haloacid dehalogenase-like hydrolase [Dokdonia sp. Hel_I_63]